MFHRYVEHNGQKIDYDRASWLMDRKLCQEAILALPSRDPFDYAIAERSFGIPSSMRFSIVKADER